MASLWVDLVKMTATVWKKVLAIWMQIGYNWLQKQRDPFLKGRDDVLKRGICLLLALASLLTCTALAAEPANVTVDINGVVVEKAQPTIFDGATWVAAYYVAQAADPTVAISWSYGTMTVKGERFTLTAKAGQNWMTVNDRYLYIPAGVQINSATGDLLVPLPTLARSLGLDICWDTHGVIDLTGELSPLESGDTYYNPKDLDLIARVVHHESGNQPLAGKIGVANVILNRVNSKLFPNTVSEVLYQKNQFTGATNATPSAHSIIAAKLAMEGANTVGKACWFNGVGKSFWASRHKSLIATIGGHSFYG